MSFSPGAQLRPLFTKSTARTTRDGRGRERDTPARHKRPQEHRRCVAPRQRFLSLGDADDVERRIRADGHRSPLPSACRHFDASQVRGRTGKLRQLRHGDGAVRLRDHQPGPAPEVDWRAFEGEESAEYGVGGARKPRLLQALLTKGIV